jgi:CheY-like chemotaxis protein/anti-sigma regulatory factor (Ser/Thr protein kinase)
MTKKRVLLVEDDDAVRAVLALVLDRAGWEVESVPGVDQAELCFADRPTDVVLSDLVMPGRGAMELLAALRKRDPRLAFVVMSGYLTDERFREALHAGASDCLAKPCEANDLTRALDRAIVLRRSIVQDRGLGGEHAMVVTVPADLGQRSALLGQVDVTAQAGGFDLRRNRILLALDEAFSNAVIHAARRDASLTIEVRASFSQHGGVVTVSDPGPGFDPVLAEIGKDEAHRRRGLYLIRSACDDARWIGRGNVCQMIFRQPSADERVPADQQASDSSHTYAKPSRRVRSVSSTKLQVPRGRRGDNG